MSAETDFPTEPDEPGHEPDHKSDHESDQADATSAIVSAWDRAENAAAYARFCAASDYYRSVSRALVGAAQLTQGERVCDLGCGTGETLLAITQVLGATAQVVAIDPALAMIRQAQQVSWPEGIEFVRGTSRQLSSLRGNHGFDAVLCSSAAWLHPHREALLREVFSSLAPRGRLALSIPSEFVGESAHLTEPSAQRFLSLLSSLRTELGLWPAQESLPSVDSLSSFTLSSWIDQLSSLGFARVSVVVHPFVMPIRDWAEHLAIPAVLDGLLPEASDVQRRQFVLQLTQRCAQDEQAARPWHLIVAWRA